MVVAQRSGNMTSTTNCLRATHATTSGAGEGYLLLVGHYNTETIQYFIPDLKAFQVERFCKSMDVVYHDLPYARFRPSLLSPPSKWNGKNLP